MVYINLVAVLVSALVANAIGALWYSPMFFGKRWMKLAGKTEADMQAAKKSGTGKLYALNFLSSLVMAYVLAHIIYFVQADTLFAGAWAGFWSWLGFVATVTLGNVLWEGKPWQLWVLNNAYNLLSIALMGAILAIWS